MGDDQPIQLADETRPSGTPGAPVDATAAAPVADRRRPGRVTYANQALIALLRTPSELKTISTQGDRDGPAPAKGMGIGVLLLLLLWEAIGLVAWYFVLTAPNSG
jgi:hypothetical protein